MEATSGVRRHANLQSEGRGPSNKAKLLRCFVLVLGYACFYNPPSKWSGLMMVEEMSCQTCQVEDFPLPGLVNEELQDLHEALMQCMRVIWHILNV